MSLEMQPSPVTGLRRRKDELRRDAERTDTGGGESADDEAEVVEVVDDKDDIGDI